MVVQWQRKILFESNLHQAETWNIDKYFDLFAFTEAGLIEFVEAFLLHFISRLRAH